MVRSTVSKLCFLEQAGLEENLNSQKMARVKTKTTLSTLKRLTSVTHLAPCGGLAQQVASGAEEGV